VFKFHPIILVDFYLNAIVVVQAIIDFIFGFDFRQPQLLLYDGDYPCRIKEEVPGLELLANHFSCLHPPFNDLVASPNN